MPLTVHRIPIVIAEDDLEIDIVYGEWRSASFRESMNSVSFHSTVDALVKFNDPDSEPIVIYNGFTYNYVMEIITIYAKSLYNENGVFRAWGEKIM